MTNQRAHCTVVDMAMCGWANIKVARSQSRFCEYTRRAILIRSQVWVTQSLSKDLIEELMIVVVAQRFCKEAVTWRSLRHPNVLPLLGVTMSGKVFAMVSEWMANGNINEFVKAHGDVNRFELVGFCPHR
jgi:serine/threonine protein kinase